MLASMCRLDMQTGNTELAVAALQANLEYSCFPAPVIAGELGLHMVEVNNVRQAGYLEDSCCHAPVMAGDTCLLVGQQQTDWPSCVTQSPARSLWALHYEFDFSLVLQVVRRLHLLLHHDKHPIIVLQIRRFRSCLTLLHFTASQRCPSIPSIHSKLDAPTLQVVRLFIFHTCSRTLCLVCSNRLPQCVAPALQVARPPRCASFSGSGTVQPQCWGSLALRRGPSGGWLRLSRHLLFLLMMIQVQTWSLNKILDGRHYTFPVYRCSLLPGPPSVKAGTVCLVGKPPGAGKLWWVAQTQ